MKNTVLLSVSIVALGLMGCSKQSGTAEMGSDAPNKVTGNPDGKRTEIVSNDTAVATGTAASTERGSVENKPSGRGDRDVSAKVGEDSELLQRVRVAISTGSAGTTGRIAESQLSPIQVAVTNGAVTLTGTVDEKKHDNVVAIVRGLPGVTDVRDELKTPAAK